AHLLAGLGLDGLAADAELALAHLGVDPRDVPADGAQAAVVVQLAGGRLEPKVEQLLLGLGQGVGQRAVLQAAELLRGQVRGTECHQMSPPSRVTKRAFMGSLCIARRSASRAISSETPESSNMTRPGLTLATHPSGERVPEPIPRPA